MKTPAMAMEYARQRMVWRLHEPRVGYRVGKVASTNVAKRRREVVAQVDGPGVLTRIWTTHLKADQLWLDVFVDDAAQPTISGPAHELAAAAARVCCPAVPLGGYEDQRSMNLYLPIAFERSLKVEAEPLGETGNGPYWQVDYARGSIGERPPRVRQVGGGDEPIAFELEDASDSHSHSDRGLGAALTPSVRVIERQLELDCAKPKNLWIEGGGLIRQIAISSERLDSLLLRLAFDGPRSPGGIEAGDEGQQTDAEDDRLDGPFQVDAPLRYLVGPFNNACVERLGSTAVIHFPMPFRTRAGLQLLAAMDYGAFHNKHLINVRIEYEPTPAPEPMRYFHARFHAAVPNGRDDLQCLSTRGRGHFVGIHLFDTGHDHGGGDNIFFDAGSDHAGQLHGVCGEDYFHMAYMRIWNRTPYSGCPSHAARYRHHLELPIPFEESFVFNWGCFAGQPAKSVAFWYQEPSTSVDLVAAEDGRVAAPRAHCAQGRELMYTLAGPFELSMLDALKPGEPLPAEAVPWRGGPPRPARRWAKAAQQGFVDLCHMHRRYLWAVPPSAAEVRSDCCACADTRLWLARGAEVVLRLGCDDPIRLYVNGRPVFADDGRDHPDPFHLFKLPMTLPAGLNTLRVVVGNTPNHNWHWNGFSLVIESDLREDQWAAVSGEP